MTKPKDEYEIVACSEDNNLPEVLPEGCFFSFEPGDGSIAVYRKRKPPKEPQ